MCVCVCQAHAGIFHYLPLGQRVHEKLEKLIDKHMRSIGEPSLCVSLSLSRGYLVCLVGLAG
jgi:prolyl-tRNA synthetase